MLPLIADLFQVVKQPPCSYNIRAINRLSDVEDDCRIEERPHDGYGSDCRIDSLLSGHFRNATPYKPKDVAEDDGDEWERNEAEETDVIESLFMLFASDKVDHDAIKGDDLCWKFGNVLLHLQNALNKIGPAKLDSCDRLKNLEMIQKYLHVDGSQWFDLARASHS